MAFTEREPRAVILVAEDEPGLLEAMELLLDLEGFAVIPATNGNEALDRMLQNGCDLLITDFMMPVMDGAELVGRIRADPAYREMPIILTSAVLPPDTEIVDDVDAFLCKPFTLTRVLQVIELLLEKSRLKK
jgi:CheY-like chemotaxis protein